MIRTLINGLCMALADSVPGVSGGTIALILGFYDDFIGAVHDLIYGKTASKKIALKCLIKLGIGWVSGMLIAIYVLTAFFEKSVYSVSSLFFALVLCSIPIIAKEEYKSLKGKKRYLVFTVCGIVLVVLLTYCNVSVSMFNGDLSSLDVLGALYIFVSGGVAICAMFLPGISGSTVLLILGVYVPLLKSVKECMKFNFQHLSAVLIFAAGVLAGAVLSVKGIKVCLNKFRSQTVYSVIGMLFGSLYAIVTGTTAHNATNQPLLPYHLSLPWFFAGIAIIVIIQLLKCLREQKIPNKLKKLDLLKNILSNCVRNK
ncbi:MAG: DUF368 domain-containing protein [Acutalibacteraceae bacterium]